MAKRNLTREKVIDAAIQLMEEKKSTALEMKELAAYLCIKSASLYNHVESLSAVYYAAGEKALSVLTAKMQEAIAGKTGETAIIALARCNRGLAKESPALYRLYLQLPVIAPEVIAIPNTCHSIYHHLFRGYAISETRKLHLTRMLRSLIHGFISLETGGYFQDTGATREESFDYMLTEFLQLLQTATERQADYGAETD